MTQASMIEDGLGLCVRVVRRRGEGGVRFLGEELV